MSKKKNKSKMTSKRKDRLQAAKNWIKEYEGNNLVKGYRKRFKVDLLCAVKELETLGCKIDPGYKKQLELTVENKIKKNKEKKAKEESESLSDLDSDDTFSFIAGYTSGGAAYGTSWEELDDYDDDADYELPF